MSSYKYYSAAEDLFNEFSIVSYYTSLISTEIKYLFNKKNICYCKKKILEVKWNHWMRWWLSHSSFILKNDVTLDNIIYQDILDVIGKVNEEYKEELISNKTVSNSMLFLFEELHELLVKEFIDLLYVYLNNCKSKESYLKKVGSFLHILCINSIFELSEIGFSCDDLKGGRIPESAIFCDYIEQERDSTLKIFVNNVYNINSFAIKKMKKIKSLVQNSKNLNIIMNFQYYDDEITDKIIKVYKYIKEEFKDVEMTNISEENRKIILEGVNK